MPQKSFLTSIAELYKQEESLRDRRVLSAKQMLKNNIFALIGQEKRKRTKCKGDSTTSDWLLIEILFLWDFYAVVKETWKCFLVIGLKFFPRACSIESIRISKLRKKSCKTLMRTGLGDISTVQANHHKILEKYKSGNGEPGKVTQWNDSARA